MACTDCIPIEHPWVRHESVPIYEWVFPVDLTDEDLAGFIRAREDWAKVAEYPVAWVVELSNITKASAKQRQAFAAHLERFEVHDLRWNAGSALVVPNPVIRGLVTAVFWMSPPRFPHQAFPSRALAIAWATQQLDEKLSGQSQSLAAAGGR